MGGVGEAGKPVAWLLDDNSRLTLLSASPSPLPRSPRGSRPHQVCLHSRDAEFHCGLVRSACFRSRDARPPQLLTLARACSLRSARFREMYDDPYEEG